MIEVEDGKANTVERGTLPHEAAKGHFVYTDTLVIAGRIIISCRVHPSK
jgi:hypothetical protein